ncbi:MAG: hypothetical protein ACJ8GO_14800 [Ramlibacter sp.]
MSFGPLFTLRTRGRQARPDAADEPFPTTAGWNERRTRVAAEPGPGTPKRRAGDKSRQEPRTR